MIRFDSIKGYTALVTGATSGIGLAYSELLAQSGCKVILVSIESSVSHIATDLCNRYGVESMGIELDLAHEDSADKLYAWCKNNGVEVDILINNAGIFYFKELILLPQTKVEAMMNLHMVTVAKLTRLFAIGMCDRKRGYILNMSSICADMPNPGLTMYASTKAFVKSFTTSMWYELRDYGVNICCVTPGGVATGLYSVDEKWIKLGLKFGVLATPENIAKRGIDAMLRGRRLITPYPINRFFVWLVNGVPTWLRMKLKRKFL